MGELGDMNLYRGMFNSPLNVVDRNGQDNYKVTGYPNTQENFQGSASFPMSAMAGLPRPTDFSGMIPPPFINPVALTPNGSIDENRTPPRFIPGLQTDDALFMLAAPCSKLARLSG